MLASGRAAGVPTVAAETAFQVHGAALVRRAHRAPARRPEPVETLTVHRGIWQTALRLAEGDPRRIQIVHARRVEVWPAGYPWRVRCGR
jgi:hypothetical protein